MLYYRVKKEYDNKPRYKFHRGGGLKIDGIMIGGELYTAKECKKYSGLISYCEPIEIPKSKIYFFFGARLAAPEGVKKC